MKILNLTLSKAPFEVMVTGEKKTEFRKPSKWIESRLWDKNDIRKEYDLIKFVNGYGSDKPYFICEYKGFKYVRFPFIKTYSNGLSVNVELNDIKIFLGEIIEKRNLKE